MWDIGLQNIMTQRNFWGGGKVSTKMTFTIHCPCAYCFKKWRLHYPKKFKCNYHIDDDKCGFEECQSGEFVTVHEFYKHLVLFEQKCFYHEAMIDIFSILYPVLYQSVANKKKHTQLYSLQKHMASNNLVRKKLQINSSLHYFIKNKFRSYY